MLSCFRGKLYTVSGVCNSKSIFMQYVGTPVSRKYKALHRKDRHKHETGEKERCERNGENQYFYEEIGFTLAGNCGFGRYHQRMRYQKSPDISRKHRSGSK